MGRSYWRLAGSSYALALAAFAAACTADASSNPGDQPVVRDSASVRIVENGQLGSASWRAGSEPLFTVGWDPEDPTFTWMQSGYILPDGGALLGEYQAGVVYRIGADGAVAESWGRQGEGPGEYQGFDAMLFSGDSIFISDGRLVRLTVLSSDGEVLATQQQPGGYHHSASSLLPGRRVLLTPGGGYSALRETRPEWIFEELPILTMDLDDGAVDTPAILPYLKRWAGTRAGSQGPAAVHGTAGGFSGGFAWARADRTEVHWFDDSGALTQIARWDEAPRPLDDEWRDRVLEAFREGARAAGAEEPVVNRGVASIIEGLDRHEGPLPYWRSFHVDREGNAWLGEYRAEGPAQRWRVVARDGRLVGWVDLPDVMAILDITEDRILAVRLDDLDVPAAFMFELVRS